MFLISQITSAFFQLLFFSFIPLMGYIFTHKKPKGFLFFLHWIGIKTVSKPPLKIMLCILMSFLFILILPYMWLFKSGNLNYVGFTVDSFRQSGWSLQTVCVILVWAVVQTSLSEEILFRGFFGKRLCNHFGEKVGNIIQAAGFGAVHVLTLPNKSVVAMLTIALLAGGIGYVLGWLSFKKAQGSILYGWAIHATVNILSPIVVFSFLLPN